MLCPAPPRFISQPSSAWRLCARGGRAVPSAQPPASARISFERRRAACGPRCTTLGELGVTAQRKVAQSLQYGRRVAGNVARTVSDFMQKEAKFDVHNSVNQASGDEAASAAGFGGSARSRAAVNPLVGGAQFAG